jgi:parallel beta-helix repeat protein
MDGRHRDRSPAAVLSSLRRIVVPLLGCLGAILAIIQDSPYDIEPELAVLNSLNPLPRFEKNLGQTCRDVDFLCRSQNQLLLLGHAGSSLHLLDDHGTGTFVPVRMDLCGANPRAKAEGAGEFQSRSNYYRGGDKSSWLSAIPHYARVKYEESWPGIDMVYYFRDHDVEFDFMVEPGADPRMIRLAFSGAARIEKGREGNLYLHAGDHLIVYHKPSAWQQRKGRRENVAVQFVLLDDHRVEFDIGLYDRSETLTIDPQIVYSTYLGGSDSDTGNGIAVDESGCLYVTGSTVSPDFPVMNAFQSTLAPGMFSNLSDVYVTKMTADGRDIVYSTYLGGRWDDRGAAIAVDAVGRACLTGQTSSNDDPGKPGYQGFPVKNAFQETIGDPNFSDAFVTVLDRFGGLYYSTYLGGKYEDAGTDIAVDATGAIFVTGKEFSFDFPVKNAFLSVKPGYYFDAFFTKIDPSKAGNASLVYSTHLGGTADSYGNAIALDRNGCAYITGKTGARDFPVRNAIEPAYLGSGDAFVTKIDPEKSGTASLIYSTFLGSTGSNEGLGIAVDASGCAVVSGHGPVAVTPGAFTTPGSAFISKLNAAGSGFLYSARPYSAQKLAMDESGAVYAAASVVRPFAGPGVLALAADGSDTLFTCKIGVTPQDITTSGNGEICVTGTTTMSDFPVINPFQPGLAGKSDIFIVKLRGEVKKTLTVTPDPLYFPLTLPGDISRETIEITSTGGDAVELQSIEVEPSSHFALENGPALPVSLNSGEKIEFQIVYTPLLSLLKKSTTPMTGTGVLTIISNADEPVKKISLMTEGIIVNDTGDASDYDLEDGICDSDPVTPGNQGTLRAAIENVNVLKNPNPTIVYFRIPGTGIKMIEPLSALPVIEYPIHVDIPERDAPIILSGAKSAGFVDGLVIQAGYNLMKNILFEKWRGNGLRITGQEGSFVENCVFRNNGYQGGDSVRAGLLLDETASNRIRNNLVYDNNGCGIQVRGESARINTIEENRVGYNELGSSTGKVQLIGIHIFVGHDNIIRNNEVGRNVCGIAIEGIPEETKMTAGNQILSNWIGSDRTGLKDYGNSDVGVLVSGSEKTVIENNLISWNGENKARLCAGIMIIGLCRETQVKKNTIGPDISGLDAETESGNLRAGIHLRDGVSYTKILENLISGNRGDGIIIAENGSADRPVHHTTIERNIIGLDRTGAGILANQGSGISLRSRAYSNTIMSNTISGNSLNGITILTGTAANSITDNRIGTDVSGKFAASNGKGGIFSNLSSNCLIVGNTVSGNRDAQVSLFLTTPGNMILMNNTIGPGINGEEFRLDGDTLPVGIELGRASAVIDENQIAYNSIGIQCRWVSNADIAENRIHNNQLGLQLTDSPALIALNAIYDNERGIDVDNADMLQAIITGNEIYHNFGLNSGIHLTSGRAAITGNYIHDDAGDGITVAGRGSPVIRKNNFKHNQGFGVHYTGSASNVDARYNYWNDASGPGGSGPGGGDKVSAGIDYAGWRGEAVSLFVYPERDTVRLKTGKQDQVTLYFKNWAAATDVVEYTVESDQAWVVPQQTRMLGLGYAIGASDLVNFFVPDNTPAGTTARVEVRAVSTNNPAHRDTVHFIVSAGAMTLHQVTILPDSVTLAPGETLQFIAQGYDQFAGTQPIHPLWQCTGGTIDPAGVYVAGQAEGLFQVTVSDSVSAISAHARVLIAEVTGLTGENESLPLHFDLSQNYPNPFNQSTRLHFTLAQPADVKIEIFNIQGRKVRTLVDAFYPAGKHASDWDGMDDQRRMVAGGVYLYRISVPNFVSSKKMVLLR